MTEKKRRGRPPLTEAEKAKNKKAKTGATAVATKKPSEKVKQKKKPAHKEKNLAKRRAAIQAAKSSGAIINDAEPQEEQKGKRKVGRPTNYKSSYCDIVLQAMSKGLSKEAAGAQIGIWYSTFDRWQQDHEEFREAILQGERLSRLFWEKLGIMGVSGQINGFNSTAWIYNMSNRFKWRHKQPDEARDELKEFAEVLLELGKKLPN
jgi:hypothetical protein